MYLNYILIEEINFTQPNTNETVLVYNITYIIYYVLIN